MSEFVIKVQELEAGGKQYDFPITRAWLDASIATDRAEHPASSSAESPLRADPGAPDGLVSVRAEKAGEDVIVRGTLRARLLAECSRCLADAPIPVDGPLVALFTARNAEHRPVADEEELTPDEIEKEFFSGDRVVLDAIVREQILLEVPMQPLCSETCVGLEVPEAIRGPADLSAEAAPVHEGKKIDPRLAPLLDIMQKSAPRTGTTETAKRPEKPGRDKKTKKGTKGSI